MLSAAKKKTQRKTWKACCHCARSLENEQLTGTDLENAHDPNHKKKHTQRVHVKLCAQLVEK